MKFPTAQSILLIIAAFAALATWFIPAGTYNTLTYNASDSTFVEFDGERSQSYPATQATLDQLNVKIPVNSFTDGGIYKPIGIPGTYKKVEARPQGFFAFIQAPIKGVIATSDIIFLVLVIGGLIGVMSAIGAFDAGIAWLSNVLKGKEYILIIVTTALISIGGTTFGLGEETIAFYPILIPVFLAARYDAMVGIASIFMGSSIGVMCSTINPFATIIASDSAGIQWTDGLTGRLIVYGICLVVGIIYILMYARKVQKDPSRSILIDQKAEFDQKYGTMNAIVPKLNSKLILILSVFALCFVVMIYGVSMLEWWFVEMSTVFLAGAILIGFIARINETDFINAFVKGAGDLLGVAFIIGIARGVSILMNDGLISDTLLFHASTITDGMNKVVFVNALFFIFNGLSFLISSSSGLAVLSMPIIAPLTDGMGLGREIIVNAYQYGIGLFNFINPTGLILPSLAVVSVGFNKWFKFIWPLLLIYIVIIMIALTISVYS